MKRLILFILWGWLFPICLFAQNVRPGHDWNVNTSAYDFNMTLIVQVQVSGELNPALELGAFCGPECRGIATAQYENALGTYLWYLVIHGNSGDPIEFFVRVDGEELKAETTYHLAFVPNEVIGQPAHPQIIDFVNLEPTGCISFEDGGFFAENKPYSGVMEVYDINGRLVQTIQLDPLHPTLHPHTPSGIYIVRTTLGTGEVLTKKIVIY